MKTYQRILAVAFYDYKKAYDKVHHDWMLRVYKWIGILDNVITLLSSIMRKWKITLGIWKDGEKSISRWIDIMRHFLQGNSCSPVGFCISEIPICQLFQESKWYRMRQPGKKNLKCTHSFFLHDLKVYQESHKNLKDVNEVIVQAINDTSACYRATKCAEVVFERRKMVKGEGLQVLNERMKTIDPDENDICKFLGVEQADGINRKKCITEWKKKLVEKWTS